LDTQPLWYPASFTRFINSIAEQEGHPRMATVTETTLRKILANAKIHAESGVLPAEDGEEGSGC